MYKKIKILHKITLSVLSIIISSCSLENEDQPNSNVKNSDNEIIEGKTIYIVGDSYNENNEYTSCYWVNGERVELPGGYTATDIVVSNGNIYMLQEQPMVQHVIGLISSGMIYLVMVVRQKLLQLMVKTYMLLDGITMDLVIGKMDKELTSRLTAIRKPLQLE